MIVTEPLAAFKRAFAASTPAAPEATKTVVCVDLDGVIAFLLEASLGALNAHFGTDYLPDETHNYWFEQWLPDEQAAWMGAQFQTPTFYATLAPDYAAIAALAALKRAGVTLWAATDRPLEAQPVTDSWLQKWGVPVERLAIGPGAKLRIAAEASAERPLLFVDDDYRKAAELPGAHVTLWCPKRPWTPETVKGARVFHAWTELLDVFGVRPRLRDVPQLGSKATS